MLKQIAFVLTTTCALASLGTYLVINEKIIAGERSIAEGKNNIEIESPALTEGKADLASGKQLLSAGKQEYKKAHDNPLMVWADKLFNGEKGFTEGREKIAEGEAKVARGENRVDVGEKRLADGNDAIRIGMEKLKQGRVIRDVFAILAIIFSAASLVLGFLLRNSLAYFFKYPKV